MIRKKKNTKKHKRRLNIQLIQVHYLVAQKCINIHYAKKKVQKYLYFAFAQIMTDIDMIIEDWDCQRT